jgi:hypothetical protein
LPAEIKFRSIVNFADDDYLTSGSFLAFANEDGWKSTENPEWNINLGINHG